MRPRTRSNPEQAESVLVLQFMLPLGVLVHTTPLFEAMKRSRPGLSVTVVTRGSGLEVFRHNPFIDHLMDLPDPMVSLGKAVEGLRHALEAHRILPDGCMTPVSERRTRVALLAAGACNGWRGGYTRYSSLYHHAFRVDGMRSQIVNNLRLSALIGCSSEMLEPKVFYSPEDAAAAHRLLESVRQGDKPVLVVVTQGSGGQATAWHVERWVEVIQHAAGTLGHCVVYVGTGADSAAIESLRESTGGLGTSLAGQTSVCELTALLALSDLVVSLDTGTMHVARATGVPMVVLGPSWQRAVEWLPLDVPQVLILRGPDRTDTPPGYRLDEISGAAVMKAMEEMMFRFPASMASRQGRLQAGLSAIDHLR